MPHVEQQSHGCTTLASKHANHLTISKVRAPLLRVHTTLYDARTNDRETQCDRKRRTRSPLNFKHAQKSDATAGERKIACNGSDSSCNVGEPSCECQKAGSQSVLKWSCANCERGFKQQLCEGFKMKDMGKLHYLLGISVQMRDGKVMLDQKQYLINILRKFGLEDAKTSTVSTPSDLAGGIPCHQWDIYIDGLYTEQKAKIMKNQIQSLNYSSYIGSKCEAGKGRRLQ